MTSRELFIVALRILGFVCVFFGLISLAEFGRTAFLAWALRSPFGGENFFTDFYVRQAIFGSGVSAVMLIGLGTGMIFKTRWLANRFSFEPLSLPSSTTANSHCDSITPERLMQISLQITGIWIAVGGISPLTNVLIVWFLPGMFVPSSNGHELSLFLTAMVHFVVGLGFVLGKNAIMQKIDRWRNPSGASDVLRAEFKDVSQDDSQTISPVK